jgi:CHAT domain-containing protein
MYVDFVRHGDYDFKRRTWKSARYFACIVPPAGKGDVALIDLGPVEAVEKAVEAVRRVLQDPRKSIVELGEPESERELKTRLGKLADLVLRPLYPHLGPAPRWVLGPDAALWLVPFEALPLDDGSYAVEKHSIRYVVSGRELLAAGRTTVRPAPALVLADPDFDLKSAKAKTSPGIPTATSDAGAGNLATSTKLPAFARLPGTAAEAAAVVPALERFTRLKPVLKTGPDAQEKVVKSAKSPRVLLLSTHGYFLPDQEAAVPELFADALPTAMSKAGKPLENPFVRSGLALAGANHRGDNPARGDDGLLSALEVLGCDLMGTDLVVLSACDTGLGQIDMGQGVSGLRQAFHLAGAKAVLASLWQVPDRPTAELMAAFFAELEKNGDRAEALRRAQLRLIERRRELDGAAHPFFWAAFTLTVAGQEPRGGAEAGSSSR